VREVFKIRALRLLFVANFVSMVGSGMNSAAVVWFILQATHSEQKLGLLVVCQVIPSLLLLPFSGVIIDREDRRHLCMLLDAARGVIILTVAILAATHHVQVWHVFVMNVMVSTGFWMFWPTITALLQELTPDSEFAHSNAALLAGFQGGWLIAGAVVGFVYNHIGLGGILFVDFATYCFSILCYAFVREGRHVVAQAVRVHAGAVRQFVHELRDGLRFVSRRITVKMIGITWALFVCSMQVTSVVAAPISDRILHTGAVGYGWMNAGWGIGAFIGSVLAADAIARFGWKGSIPASMAVLSICLYALPFSMAILMAASLLLLAGIARGIGGIALSATMMEIIPKHYMGRVQNLFNLCAIGIQIMVAPLVGGAAQKRGLIVGTAVIGTMYLLATIAGLVASKTQVAESDVEVAATAKTGAA
jgi:MFS family permease